MYSPREGESRVGGEDGVCSASHFRAGAGGANVLTNSAHCAGTTIPGA